MAKEKQGLLAQYLAVKNENRDGVVLFQVGGFYQLYYHDAVVAQEKLGMQMISRAVGDGKRAPLCGIPVSAAEKYGETLRQLGYRVVICKQQQAADGHISRVVTDVLAPEGEAIDLTAAWEQYLAAEEEIPLPVRRKQRCGLAAELQALRLEEMTPIEALLLLQKWQKKYHD